MPPISHRSPVREEEEEEEDDMPGLVHNFATRKRKRDATLEQSANTVPEGVRGSSQLGISHVGPNRIIAPLELLFWPAGN